MRIVPTLLLIALASFITACPAQPTAIGVLEVRITGLTPDVQPNVTVSGPNEFKLTITDLGNTKTVISNLPVGSYTIAADDISSMTATVTGSPATVTANTTSNASVAYAAAQ
jgi:hypothetical protein